MSNNAISAFHTLGSNASLEKLYEKERQEKSFPLTRQPEFFSDGQPRDTGSILCLGTPALIVD